jgi:hypothetical protein
MPHRQHLSSTGDRAMLRSILGIPDKFEPKAFGQTHEVRVDSFDAEALSPTATKIPTVFVIKTEHGCSYGSVLTAVSLSTSGRSHSPSVSDRIGLMFVALKN